MLLFTSGQAKAGPEIRHLSSLSSCLPNFLTRGLLIKPVLRMFMVLWMPFISMASEWRMRLLTLEDARRQVVRLTSCIRLFRQIELNTFIPGRRLGLTGSAFGHCKLDN